MHTFTQLVVILHFLGLAMGFATGIANSIMLGLIAKAAPPEKSVLARFPPVMSRVGETGIALLWLTGLILVYMKWGGFASFPWTFYVKVTAVVILTIVVLRVHTLGRRVAAGDTAAAASIPVFGKIAMVMALTAVVFAVLTFG